MLLRRLPMTCATIAVVCAALGATACGAFDVAGGGTSEGGGGTLPDGATGADGGGEAATDGGGGGPGDADLDARVMEGGGATDGAITPFDAKCYGNEVKEVEPNDFSNEATSFTRAACGDLSAGDTDWFTVDLVGTAPLNVGFNTSGDAILTIRKMGTGDSVQGSSPGGGYRFVSFPSLTSPGTYLFRFDAATTAQTYRLVVTH